MENYHNMENSMKRAVEKLSAVELRLYDSGFTCIPQYESKNKLKKFRGFEEAPEENDSVKAIIRDYDFNEGKRSGKIIRAEMVARHQLKKLGMLDVENNRPTFEMRNKATRMTITMERGRRLSYCEYDSNKNMAFQLIPSDVRSLQLIPSDNKSQQIFPKEGLDAENSSPSKHVDRKNIYTPCLHDNVFIIFPNPEMRDKATKMMRAMELGPRLSCEFDLNKNMIFE